MTVWSCCLAVALCVQQQTPTVSPARVTRVVAGNELAWWAATEDAVVGILGDGTTICRDLRTGVELRRFALRDFEYAARDCVLLQSRPPLLVVASSDDMDNTLIAMDVTTGREVGRLTVPESPGMHAIGVSPDARKVGYVANTGTSLLIVELGAAPRIERYPCHDVVAAGYCLAPANELVASFVPPNRIVARGLAGQVAWRSQPAGVNSIEPPSARVCAPFLAAYSADLARLYAISWKDGSTLWDAAAPSIGSLRAISTDGRQQVFWIDGRVMLTHWPEDSARPVEWPGAAAPDAAFTPSGDRLILLPALRPVDEQPADARVQRLARPAGKIRVLDCGSTRVIAEFPFLPEDAGGAATSEPARTGAPTR